MSESAEAQVRRLGPWFHNLHLPGGLETAPDHHLGDFPRFKWLQIAPHLPFDLTGARVLDIGCNAGFYSFALAERGASVLGIDTDEHYLRQARWAKERFAADRVTFERRSVYEVHELGRFDIVLFMGVFYHLRHPLLALDLLARTGPRTLVFQSLTFGDERVAADAASPLDYADRERLADPAWPKMAFVETSFADDPTNWWVPDHGAITAMLRSSGFVVDTRPGHEIYLCRHTGSRACDDDATALAAHAARECHETGPSP
ncbi:MAG: TIGR04290 family methyltransferase [Geminicoccaceae bacterium]|nr:TIGR04290 family methyltransferase [Geminicoccaceae bacterium]